MTLDAFATTDAISTRLGRDFASDAEEAQAAAFLDDASWAIRDYCRQEFNAQTGLSVTFESPEGPWLDLPQRPVTAVTSAAVNGTVVGDFTQVGDRLYRAFGWRWPSINTVPPLAIYGTVSTVTVVYDAGYATIPATVAAVCVNAAMRAFDNPVGAVRESIDDYTRDFANRGTGDSQATGTGVFLDTADMKRLRRYRRGSFMVDMGGGRYR